MRNGGILYHLANALREETVRQIRHETGEALDLPKILPHREQENEYPFAVSFKISTWGHRGHVTYIVTIAEVDN